MRTASHRLASPVLLGAGLMLVAFNLRPALTTVGPLLAAIRAGTGLGPTGAAVLTMLPPEAFAAFDNVIASVDDYAMLDGHPALRFA